MIQIHQEQKSKKKFDLIFQNIRYESKLLENAINATPLNRLGSVEEISSLMTYLVLPISKFITGQCYYIDGGQSLYGDFYKISKSKL